MEIKIFKKTDDGEWRRANQSTLTEEEYKFLRSESGHITATLIEVKTNVKRSHSVCNKCSGPVNEKITSSSSQWASPAVVNLDDDDEKDDNFGEKEEEEEPVKCCQLSEKQFNEPVAKSRKK
mgnify:CR=1 FL=1